MTTLTFDLREIMHINYALTQERDLLQNQLQELISINSKLDNTFMVKQINTHNDLLLKIETFAANYGNK